MFGREGHGRTKEVLPREGDTCEVRVTGTTKQRENKEFGTVGRRTGEMIFPETSPTDTRKKDPERVGSGRSN